jgi:hypothetical protein
MESRLCLLGTAVLLLATGCADLTRTGEVRLIKERPVPAKAAAEAQAPMPAGMPGGMAMPGEQPPGAPRKGG